MHLSPMMETNLVRGWRVANVQTCTCARSLRGMLECIHVGKGNLRRKAGHVPILVQKADHPRPTCFDVIGFVLHARLCDLTRVVVSSDGNERAETLALSFQSFLYKALRSMLRNLSFYVVILYVFSKISKFCGGELVKKVVEFGRRRWRGRGGSGFSWRKDSVLAKGFVAGKNYIIGRI
jgi:hypothetical protein